MTTNSMATMSDRDLLNATARVVGDERRSTADLLALLGELDGRRLYLSEGCSSLFTYCTQVLHLSEHAAYHRIEAARAARQFPIILRLVADGSVTLTTVALLRPHLTAVNHESRLAAARHQSKREVEHQIACFAPKPDAKAVIRRLPEASGNGPSAGNSAGPAASEPQSAAIPPAMVTGHAPNAHSRRADTGAAAHTPSPRIASLARDRYLLRVTLSGEAHQNLRRAQELMRHVVPDGDPAVVLERALMLLVDQLERAKIAKVARPRGRSSQSSTRGSRHIPAAIRREVWGRDEGRCAFVGQRGRCTETGHLEFHHVTPFARGGATTVANVSLRCRAHNRYESEQLFGPWQGTESPVRHVS